MKPISNNSSTTRTCTGTTPLQWPQQPLDTLTLLLFLMATLTLTTRLLCLQRTLLIIIMHTPQAKHHWQGIPIMQEGWYYMQGQEGRTPLTLTPHTTTCRRRAPLVITCSPTTRGIKCMAPEGKEGGQ